MRLATCSTAFPGVEVGQNYVRGKVCKSYFFVTLKPLEVAALSGL